MANQTGAFKEKTDQFGKKITDSVTDYAQDLGDVGASAVDATRDKVSDIATHLGEKARDVASKAKQSATDAYDNVDSMISERPMQSFLIGLGLGCLVGVTITALIKR